MQWKEFIEFGEVFVGEVIIGIYGEINFLVFEQVNVNLIIEFIDMIIVQWNFQVNLWVLEVNNQFNQIILNICQVNY